MSLDDHVREKRIGKKEALSAWLFTAGIMIAANTTFAICDYIQETGQTKPVHEYQLRKTY